MAGQLYGQYQANNAINRNNVPTAAETQSNALFQAALNPNSPQMQALTQQNRTMNLQTYQQQIQQMQMADARNRAMGRASTFFNPQTADQDISYLTSRGLAPMNALSQQQAQETLMGGAKGIQTNLQPQAGRLGTSMQQGVSNAQYQSNIPSQIMQLLQGFGGGQPTGQQQTPMVGGYSQQVPIMTQQGQRQQPNYNSMVYQ